MNQPDICTKPTVLDNPALQGANRVRCAVGEPGDPRVPSLKELVRLIIKEPMEVEIDTSDL